MNMDIVDRQLCIGPMAGQITTRIGTMTLQVETSYTLANIRLWHGCIFSSVAERFLMTSPQNVTFDMDLVDLFLQNLLLIPALNYAKAEQGLH